MNDKIIDKIIQKQNKILSNINNESIFVYLFLEKEHKKGKIENNNVFQFVFRSYYRLDNAGLGKELKNEYFDLLKNRENDLRKILLKLYRINNLKGLKTIQFSFATKLLHTLDNNSPIFDAEISRVFHKKVQGRNKDEKIDSCLRIYAFLKIAYKEFLQDERIKKLISKFRLKFNISKNKISDVKILDFIIWSYGKILKQII